VEKRPLSDESNALFEFEKLVSGGDWRDCIGGGWGREAYEYWGFRRDGLLRNVSKYRYIEAKKLSIYRYIRAKNY
jgi:hypothetical protein